MARIPTLNIPQVQRAPVAGVTMDLQSALAPSQGKMAIARGIGQLGQVAGEFAIRSARAREVATLADNERKLNEQLGAFEQEIATEPDPVKWTKIWEKHVGDAQKLTDADSRKLGPDGRAALGEQFSNWASRNTVQITTKARLGQVKEDKAKVTNVATIAFQRGDYEGGMKKIADGANVGLFSEAEVEDWTQQGRVVSDVASIESEIFTDPEAAEKKLRAGEWESITPAARNDLISNARVRAQNVREDTMRGIDEMILAVEQGDKAVNPVTVERKINEANITAEQKRWLLSRLSRTANPQTSAAAIATLWDMADKVDPKDKLAISQIREALNMFDASVRVDVQRALDEKVKPDFKQRGPTEALDALKWMRDNGSLGTFNFKQKPTEIETEENIKLFGYSPLGWMLGAPRSETVVVKDALGRPVEKLDEMGRPIVDEARWQKQLAESQSTQAFYGELKSQLIDYAKAHPEATPEDHMKFLREKTKDRADVIGADTLFNAVTGFSDDFLDDDSPQD